MKDKHQIIARKYRPQSFNEVIGQDLVVTTLKNAIKHKKTAYAYLFCGSRGIGKTTLARIFAKALNCANPKDTCEPCSTCSSCIEISQSQSLDIIEIDGASNRGIDDIRQINETVSYAPAKGSYKIYIIDEVHMLTKEAFNALLKTLEEPPEKVKFLFATTEPHKVLPTILSRCQRFDLKRISTKLIIDKLREIAKDLSREVQLEALHIIASYSEGSLRDAESILEQALCYESNEITPKSLYQLLGLLPKKTFFELDQAMKDQNFSFAFEIAKQVFDSGVDPHHFLEDLLEHFHHILSCKYSKLSEELMEAHRQNYIFNAEFYSKEQVTYLIDYLLKIFDILKKSPLKRVTLEMIFLKVIQSKSHISVKDLVQRLMQLEKSQAVNLDAVSIEVSKPSINPEPLKREQDKPSFAKVPPEISQEVKLVATPFTISDKPLKEEKLEIKKPLLRYETVMRFAAVELEGSLKIEQGEKNG